MQFVQKPDEQSALWPDPGCRVHLKTGCIFRIDSQRQICALKAVAVIIVVKEPFTILPHLHFLAPGRPFGKLDKPS